MKSPLIFRVFKNDQIHVVKQFLDKDQILFGHEAEVDVDLDSADVSPIHCLIEKRGYQYFICDLGSTQGTFKNGQMILDEAIASGDEFTVGPFRIIFFIGAPKPVHSPKTGSEVVIQPVPIVLAATPPAAEPVVSKPTAVVTPAPSAVPQSKPSIQSAVVGSKVSPRGQQFLKARHKKGRKTFAPESQIQDLREYVKPGKGQLVEVIVAWKERILTTYHFAPLGMKKLGRDQDIQTPEGAAPKNWSFLDCTNGVQIRSTTDMRVEVQNSVELRTVTDSSYRLQQNETVFVTLSNSMQLIVRFAPVAPAVPFESAAILSSSELTGVLAALIVAALTSLIVSVTAPKGIQKEEEIERVAQVIFEKPPVPVVAKLPTPPEPQKPPEPVVPPKPPEPKKPPEQPKKITMADTQKQAQTKGDPKKPDQVAQQAQQAGRAAEVKPKDPKFKAKQFTSTKQGGAVKTGNQNGANAQSKEPDLTNTGLLSAFGSGGARSKLDKAYAGSGQAIGTGEKATGASGFNENRAGDDMGSKFKDTGAGGKGTATQGIAGVGAGKGLGMSATGDGVGFGAKDQVAIQPGGAEEEFVGSIDREAVRRAVRSALAQFKACYDREYNKNSKLAGKVVITWEIHAKGIARNARVFKEKTTIGNSVVEECVRARMLTVIFPEPPGGTVAEVTYPFLFQGQK